MNEHARHATPATPASAPSSTCALALLVFLVPLVSLASTACGGSGGGSSGGSESSTSAESSPLDGAWTCSVEYTNRAGTVEAAPLTLTTSLKEEEVVVSASGGTAAEEDWFCDASFDLAGFTAKLPADTICRRSGVVVIHEGALGFYPDGSKLEFAEKGAMTLDGTTTEGEIYGVCTRN